MPWEEQLAIGTLIMAGDGGSPETFTAIAGVSSITGPSMKVTFKDTTVHSPANGKVMRRRGVLIDPGDLKFKLYWDPNDPTNDTKTGILSHFSALDVVDFKLVFPTSPTVTWCIVGSVGDFGMSEPVDGVLAADVSIQNTELIDFTGTAF